MIFIDESLECVTRISRLLMLVGCSNFLPFRYFPIYHPPPPPEKLGLGLGLLGLLGLGLTLIALIALTLNPNSPNSPNHNFSGG